MRHGDDPDDRALPRAFWDALRHDEPDPHTVDRAYRRFVAAPVHVPPPRLLLGRWLLGGFALGWGVVFAATGDPLFGARSHWLSELAPSGVPSEPPGARKPRGGTPPPAKVVGSTPPASSNDVPPTLTEAPPPAATAAPELARSRANGDFRVDPTWQRAAAALRTHDYAAAEAALFDLEHQGTPSAREAASLALAQVLLARGQTATARTRLERLSVSAHSVVTRDKARALLSAPSVGSDRSNSEPSDTQ